MDTLLSAAMADLDLCGDGIRGLPACIRMEKKTREDFTSERLKNTPLDSKMPLTPGAIRIWLISAIQDDGVRTEKTDFIGAGAGLHDNSRSRIIMDLLEG